MTEENEDQFNAYKYFYSNFEITLNCNRTIHLENLKQRQTYSGVYEGAPWGRDRMEWWPEMLRKYAEEEHKCPAIIVDKRDFPLPVAEEHLDQYRWPLGKDRPYSKEFEPISLGPITCVARFECSEIVPNKPKRDGSELAVVWFQQDFAMPIDPVVMEKIKALEWDTYAENYDL